MFPHERSLVEKMKDKPFALLGVNSDQKDGLAERLKKEKITWRSWAMGRGGGETASTDYKVQGWPTLFLIDKDGVIRKRWVGAPDNKTLDKWIEVAVGELEREASGTKGSAGN